MPRQRRLAFFAAALALGVLAVPVVLFALFEPGAQTIAHLFRANYGLLCLPLVGVVTVTYEFFITNNLQSGTVPPTAAQAQNEDMCNFVLNWADSDTTATVTHNWNLSAAEQQALLPIVSVLPTQSNTGTTVVALTANGTNTITIGKGANAGSGGTYNGYMLRPNSLIR